ncbi:MAG: hypothetical protein ACJ75Z_06905 [Solirubrobacterales bacterium]
MRPSIMGILDEAIREHLDLKRKHGARDVELREIEDEAFGSTDRPDPFTSGELFNEVGAAGTAAAEPGIAEPAEPDIGGEEPTKLVDPEALRPEPELTEGPDEPISPPEGLGPIPGQEELPGQDEIAGQEDLLDQEPEAPSEDAEPAPPSESLEDLIAEEEPFPEDTQAPPPTPEETAERPEPAGEPEAEEPEALAEPESAAPDPPPPPPEAGLEPPGRARGRVDVPTEEHPPPGDTGSMPPVTESRPEPLGSGADPEPLDEPLPPDEPEADAGGPALYDFETDEDPVPSAAEDDDFEALGPAEEEAPYLGEEEPYADEPPSGTDASPDDPSMSSGRQTYEEEEAEDLWFEKGPPQDFDFDD